MDVKSCLMCEYCYFSQGEQGYSEYTPGSDASLMCLKQAMRHAGGSNLMWEVYTRQELHEALSTAETCKLYKPDAPDQVRHIAT